MQQIAFVGLGAMGEPMVANLLKAGFPVTVVGHRRREPVDRLREIGATVAATPAEAAATCDIAILMLPSSKEVEDVLTGAGAMAEALPSGAVVVDCSTSDPASSRALAERLAARGVGFVDAGVTRGVAGAKQGKLAYFVGGTAEDFERAKPALDAMGDTYFPMGPVGAGHETKNLSNALSYGTVALVSEVLMLADQLGLDLGKLQDALMCGAASKALEGFGPRMIAHDFEPARVSIANVRAHLGMTAGLAPDGAELNLLAIARTLFDRTADKGHETSDISAVADLWPTK